MRILLLSTDSFGGHGGIALYNRDLIRALCEMQQVSEVVVIPRVISNDLGTVPPKGTFLAGVAGSKLRYVWTTTRLWATPFDLVLCGHINLLPLAAALQRVRRRPMALLVYGIDAWKRPYRYAKGLLRAVDSIWSISALTRDRMNAWASLPSTRYQLIPNAIHLPSYGLGERKTELVQRYGLEGAKVILTLCRLPDAERYKGVDEVIQCMPALLSRQPNLKYVVAGDGSDRPRLEAKAKGLSVSEHVIFTGMVKESEKADHYRLADAFVMPGSGEGFGFVFLEAMACGIPVVGSLIDGSREALRDGLLGELVDPRDLSSVSQGILTALNKPKAIPDGISHFAWPAFAERVSQAVIQLARQ